MSLKYLFDQPNLNSRQARWMEFLCEIEFDIYHIKGKKNKVADELNQNIYVTTMDIYESYLKERGILNSLVEDEYYIQVKVALR